MATSTERSENIILYIMTSSKPCGRGGKKKIKAEKEKP